MREKVATRILGACFNACLLGALSGFSLSKTVKPDFSEKTDSVAWGFFPPPGYSIPYSVYTAQLYPPIAFTQEKIPLVKRAGLRLSDIEEGIPALRTIHLVQLCTDHILASSGIPGVWMRGSVTIPASSATLVSMTHAGPVRQARMSKLPLVRSVKIEE